MQSEHRITGSEKKETMALFSARELTHSFGGPLLLDRAQFTVDTGERVCLIGRNGEGKSTLMKIVAGLIKPDDGQFERAQGLKVSYLPQSVPESLPGTVFDIVSEGTGSWVSLERAYHEQVQLLDDPDSDMQAVLERMNELQHELEACGGWKLAQQVEQVLTRLKLDATLPFDSLSGGMKRRVLLGRALVSQPDLLLLDEPTNHLDFDSIAWLESFLPGLRMALLFVTHDRAFLRRIATRILELDRGRLVSFDCDYDTYLSRKQEMLESEDTRNAVFDKKLAQEEAWIRRGIKARRTRNEGRVRELVKLRQERSQRRNIREGPSFELQDGNLSGRKVITVDALTYHWDNMRIVEDFSTVIWRGDKIGIIGPNGSGKTTLLKLLLGDLKPMSGTVTFGTRIQVAYFDQHRAQLDDNATLMQAVAGDNDHVYFGGQKRHIYSYLEDFMFDSLMARSKVSSLSGGERNRLLLARIFVQESNLLVLDEPTNDLDIETLELLEDILFQYQGTLLLVSHDREFLNRIATQTYAIEGNGRIRETVGGYDEYFRDKRLEEEALTARQSRQTTRDKPAPSKTSKPRTRTRKETHELEAIPARIDELENRQSILIGEMSQVGFGSDAQRAIQVKEELESIDRELATCFARWEALDAIPES